VESRESSSAGNPLVKYQKYFRELFNYCDLAIFELDVESDELTPLAGPSPAVDAFPGSTPTELH